MSKDANGSIGVGLLGAGVVGSEVGRALLTQRESKAQGFDLKSVLVRDTSADRVGIPSRLLTDDVEEVLGDGEIGIVIELMGGEEPARSYIVAAMSSGKHVVTANKEVIAKHGDELMRVARANDVGLSYEASVGGGIPVLAVLQDSLGANRIDTIRAIINGTTNYILTSMDESGAAFGDALSQAQHLGYAEADPTADIEAHDPVFKLSILSRLAWGVSVSPTQVYRSGISNIGAKDLRYARELGFKIKLLAIATSDDQGIRCRVHPALVPMDVPMANVNGVLNAVEFNGDLVGPLWLQGRGAGAGPTASAVLGDVLRIARQIRSGNGFASGTQVDADGPMRREILAMDGLEVGYYVRLSAVDRSGVLAKIADVFGESEISIASVIQKDSDDERGLADLVITTHPSVEARMQTAAERLRDLDVVSSLDNLIRVENYGSSTGT